MFTSLATVVVTACIASFSCCMSHLYIATLSAVHVPTQSVCNVIIKILKQTLCYLLLTIIQLVKASIHG